MINWLLGKAIRMILTHNLAAAERRRRRIHG